MIVSKWVGSSAGTVEEQHVGRLESERSDLRYYFAEWVGGLRVVFQFIEDDEAARIISTHQLGQAGDVHHLRGEMKR